MGKRLTKQEILNRISSHENTKHLKITSDLVNVKCSKHGKYTTSVKSLSSGYGCKKCGMERQKEKARAKFADSLDDVKKKIKEKYKNQIQIKTDSYKNAHEKYDFECIEHGLFQSCVNKILSGRSCPYCKGEKISNALRLTESEIRSRIKNSGHDIEILNPSDYINSDTLLEFSCPEHGEFSKKLIHAVGHGCHLCRESSIGEKMIRDFLISNEINFSEQYSDERCKNKKRLVFDFCIHLGDSIVLVEYQGEQHYKPIEFFGGEKKFKSQVKNDNIKRKFCQDNNIKLIEIKYDDSCWQELLLKSIGLK